MVTDTAKYPQARGYVNSNHPTSHLVGNPAIANKAATTSCQLDFTKHIFYLWSKDPGLNTNFAIIVSFDLG